MTLSLSSLLRVGLDRPFHQLNYRDQRNYASAALRLEGRSNEAILVEIGNPGVLPFQINDDTQPLHC